MAKFIQQGDMFGRIGTGIGKGLAEQLPQEIERGRLSAGLNRFERESPGLSPIQQLSRLSAIPGITPQMIQSFSDLARFQRQGDAYKRGVEGSYQGQPSSSPMGALEAMNAGMGDAQQLTPTQQARLTDGPQREIGRMAPMGASSAVENLRRTPNVRSTDEGVREIAPQNPTTQAALPRSPWTPARRDATVAEYLDRGFLPDQARELAADDEKRELGVPEAEAKRDAALTERSNRAKGELRRQLETRLQKSGEGVFKDITGDMLINMERGVERDLIDHPNKSYQDVANDWSNRALDLAKTNSRLNSTFEKIGIDSLLKGNENLDKLKSYQDIYRRTGNLEQYDNDLRKKGLSPQASASIAFPLSKGLKEKIGSYKGATRWGGAGGLMPTPDQMDAASRKLALDVSKSIGEDDSLLSIARAASNTDPYFDQVAFFNQLNADRDRLNLNERQRRELAEGARDILPNWMDLLIFPWFRRI